MRTSTGTIATACALSATLLVAGCGGDGGKDTKSSGEVFLQPVAAQGPDPFTDSTATAPSVPPRVTRTPQSTPRRSTPPQAAPTGTVSTPSGHLRTVSGATPGLYGGTARTGSCDVERQISYLTRDQAKARAFAQAEGISPGGIPGYLRGLTSVVLRADTQVTNHGFRDARVTGFQSVLQSGTAVLVDNRGVPRVRCACGNPLSPPVAQQTTPKRTGDTWSSYRPQNVVVVTPAPQIINIFVIYDPDNHHWFGRHHGDTGKHDHKTPPPVNPASPSVTVSPPTSPSSNSPSPCASTAPGTPGTPGTSTSPCPPTSSAPSSPSSSSPSSESPSSEPPSTESSSASSASSASSSPPESLASDTTTTSSSSFSAPVSSGSISPSL